MKARRKGDYPLDTVTHWIWKADTHSSICQTSNNTGDGSVSQMGKLRSEVLIHLDKCSQFKYKRGQQYLDITFLKNHFFLGLKVSIALIHAFVIWIFIY